MFNKQFNIKACNLDSKAGLPFELVLLFNLLIADMEEEMRKFKWGEVKIGEDKIYTLAYAADMVLLAENEEEMRSIIEMLEGYLERKGLELNREQTKIMRFRKGDGRLDKIDWRWKRKRIEEVKEFKYLGYVMQRNEDQKAHVRDRVRKATVTMR